MKATRVQFVTLGLKLPKIFDLYVNTIHGNAIMMTQTLMRPISKSTFAQDQEDQFLSPKRFELRAPNMIILAGEE